MDAVRGAAAPGVATGRAGAPGRPGAPGTASSPAEVAKLRQAAQDFEAIFINQLIRSMRQSLPGSKAILGATGQGMYQDFMDEELARTMARAGGLGLADVLARDLLRLSAGSKNPSSPPPPVPMTGSEGHGTGEGERR